MSDTAAAAAASDSLPVCRPAASRPAEGQSCPSTPRSSPQNRYTRKDTGKAPITGGGFAKAQALLLGHPAKHIRDTARYPPLMLPRRPGGKVGGSTLSSALVDCVRFHYQVSVEGSVTIAMHLSC